MTNAKPFYANGLRFECTRCSACCRHDPGYVFLSKTDLQRLADHFSMTIDQFKAKHCRVIDFGMVTRLSLLEKPNNDCAMWQDGGCSVYESRPLQCRSFPFWANNVDDQSAWDQVARDCPGIHRGSLHSAQVIEKWLQARIDEPLLEK